MTTQSEDLFLTDEEVQAITEYSRKAEQRRELQRLGLKFMVSRKGRPLVLRESLNAVLGIERLGREEKPDLDALREIVGNGPH